MDVLGLLLRAVVVFGLLGLTLWAVRRVDRGRAGARSGAAVQVLDSTRVGKGASVAVVRIGTQAYALGVTEHGVSLLTETDLPVPAPAVAADPDVETPSFAAALQTQLGLLVRPLRPGTPADRPAREEPGAAA